MEVHRLNVARQPLERVLAEEGRTTRGLDGLLTQRSTASAAMVLRIRRKHRGVLNTILAQAPVVAPWISRFDDSLLGES